ncbi:phosphatidate cytidylyltransferase, partial [Halorubrum ezzemoulense]
NLDWITRPVFGIALAIVAIAATFYAASFALLLAVLSVAAAREWHRLVEKNGAAREAWITYISVVVALLLLVLRAQSPAPWILLGVATFLVFVSASMRGARAIWHAAGVAYIGAPALTLLSLRSLAPHGASVIIGLFLVVWATDTVALISGNLIGGPRF